jgi:Transposase DDE domain
MVDVDTFLTILYVMAHDFCQTSLPPEPHPGPQAALSQSEVVTLALCGQWQGFGSERGFDRYAQRHLRAAFPSLPTREPYNRQVRRQHAALVAFFLHLVRLLAAQCCAYEALDSSGVPTRDAKRRGVGWLPGLAEIGWSNRLGWSEGIHLLLAVNPTGVITGFGFGAASTKDQPLADTFFALRRQLQPGLASVGAPAVGPYVVDKGFEGQANHTVWWTTYGAQVICPPRRTRKRPWPKPWRRWLAGVRQLVETVNEKLQYTFRLDRERPHELSGLQARLAAKMALHNFCIWMNDQLGRPRLAFADLVDW